MSLMTSACITRHWWTLLPLPQDAVNRVAAIGHHQGMPSVITYATDMGRRPAMALMKYLMMKHTCLSTHIIQMMKPQMMMIITYHMTCRLDLLNTDQMTIKLEMDQIKDYKVFQDHGKAQNDPKSRKVSNAPNGYQKIRVHLIFAVKHDGRHKARLVAGGHLTPDPIESIYSGVVSIRSLRLVIFLAKLNNLEVWGADIGNVYLEAKTKEKLYVVAGPEFEELAGHILVLYKALYGLKSSGLRWSQKIHDIMLDMGFSPCKADPCVWLRKAKCATKYEYVSIHVDDLLIACD